MMLNQPRVDPRGSMGHVPRNLPTLLMIGFEELRIISWNVRGAVHEYGKLFIKELIRSKKTRYCFVV